MKYMGVNELRKSYLDFFESKGHLKHASFSLVPQNDKSILLINAGMTPLKPYFTGLETPPRRRMTTCQKCIRTGDIENVGITARHGTFFEMLGNFSFGDYFKRDATAWAWEYMTKVLEFDPDRLYISVYEEDDEAEQIWHNEVGIPMDHLVRFGKEDNFWEHGVGPCGPCSEIYYDRGEKYGCGKPTCKVGCDCDRYMEIWNLVFTQFERQEDGSYTPLAQKNIDTGMGLERLAAVMQGVDSIFDIDTIKAVRDHICRISDKTYGAEHKTDVSIRVITDHVRSITFMASDGITPSNEGRGYVMRRLLRRAARHGRLLGIDRPFLHEIVATVIENSGDAYPELITRRELIDKVITTEEANFYRTLDTGLGILEGFIDEMKQKGQTVLDGDKAFRLFDTYGFPKDLTAEILEEKGMTYDEDGFNKAMEKQRTQARENQDMNKKLVTVDATVYNKLDPDMVTEFVGYDQTWSAGSKILAMTSGEKVIVGAGTGEKVTVFTNWTPFYATKGGQEGDVGTIQTDTGVVEVEDTIYAIGDKIGHVGTVLDGTVNVGQVTRMVVDIDNRMDTARNHSTTHLLQKALQNVLGGHVAQKGSSVNADRLRFDFTHFQAMTEEEIRKVEREVNIKILEGLSVETEVMGQEEARKSGAMALFDEKYGEKVRVVSMGDYSKELCGGTHLTNTAQAGSFKILSESGVASGVRRIEAVTGRKALEFYNNQELELKKIAAIVKSAKDRVVESVENLQQQNKALQKELESLKSQMTANAANDILKDVYSVGDIKVLCVYQPDLGMDELKNMGDTLKDKLGACVLVLAGGKEKVQFVAMATQEAVAAGAHAGNIVREAAKVCGGGGGGKPGMAQAGGKDASKAEEALKAAKAVIEAQLS